MPLSLILFIFYLISVVRGRDSFKYVDNVLVKYNARIPTVIRIGLAAKVSRVLETLVLLYYPVVPTKIKYLVVTPGAITPPEPLLVTNLPVLRLKAKVR